ncbi:hypothetical protein MASR1M90_04950 [Desulfovibrionales bacterium]
MDAAFELAGGICFLDWAVCLDCVGAADCFLVPCLAGRAVLVLAFDAGWTFFVLTADFLTAGVAADF